MTGRQRPISSPWSRRVMLDEARRHLRDLYDGLLLLNPSMAGSKVNLQVRTKGLLLENSEPVVLISNPEAEPYIRCFLEILKDTSNGSPIKAAGMSRLSEALNRSVEVEALPRPVRRTIFAGPFHTTVREGVCVVRNDTIRSCAESLLAYLRIAPAAGVGRIRTRWLHVVCGLPECGNVVEGGRGNKRFCSDECRTEFWNRRRQEADYRKKRKENRIYKQAANRKSKGAMHAKTKPKK